jgi:selenium metabolism protein YedF
MIQLDYSQHKCPYPIIETRKQILANPGVTLEVTVGDQAGRDNLTRLAQKMGYATTAIAVGDGFAVTLTSSGQPQAAQQPQATQTTNGGQTVIYCGSDQMGGGDPEFGRVLMRNFLTTLLEMDPLPVIILFVNSGINLTTSGSDVLEALQRLRDRGVDIASCGLCLDYYNKKDQLQIGRVTNMFEMVEVQNQAARVVSP